MNGANSESTPIMTSFQSIGCLTRAGGGGSLSMTGGRGPLSMEDIGIPGFGLGSFGSGVESGTSPDPKQ